MAATLHRAALGSVVTTCRAFIASEMDPILSKVQKDGDV
jgi:hypothetical protein